MAPEGVFLDYEELRWSGEGTRRRLLDEDSHAALSGGNYRRIGSQVSYELVDQGEQEATAHVSDETI